MDNLPKVIKLQIKINIKLFMKHQFIIPEYYFNNTKTIISKHIINKNRNKILKINFY